MEHSKCEHGLGDKCLYCAVKRDPVSFELAFVERHKEVKEDRLRAAQEVLGHIDRHGKPY